MIQERKTNTHTVNELVSSSRFLQFVWFIGENGVRTGHCVVFLGRWVFNIHLMCLCSVDFNVEYEYLFSIHYN